MKIGMPNRWAVAALAVFAAQLLAAPPPAQAQGPVPEKALSPGAQLANNCFGCHGPDGLSPWSIPGISGKSELFIKNMLLAFRSGAKEGTIMPRLAKGLSDQQIADIAKYLGTP